jgi:hypothetical protein
LRLTAHAAETAEITDGQRYRRASYERREESAFDRFEARPPDRSSMCAEDFAAGKNESRFLHPNYTKFSSIHQLKRSRRAYTEAAWVSCSATRQRVPCPGPPASSYRCHAACLARKRPRASFPSLAASAMLSKKPGEHSTNPERPARWISHRQGFAGLPRLFTTNE